LIACSLIKNPSGAITLCSRYVAHKQKWLEVVATCLYALRLGMDYGLTLNDILMISCKLFPRNYQLCFSYLCLVVRQFFNSCKWLLFDYWSFDI